MKQIIVVMSVAASPVVAGLAGEVEHYDLKLNFPFNKVEGPVVFGLECGDGKFGRARCTSA
jgi:hypothetical protein